MKAIDWKKLLPVGVAIITFVVLTLGYFSPVLDGKHLVQGDIQRFVGMSREIVEHREAYNEEPLWTESMFSGMPAYQVSVARKGGALPLLDKLFHGFLPMPAGYLFLYLIGMFILLMCLRVDPWIAIVGSIAFAFSSYFFVILEAGHNSKANAIGYMPMVLGGMFLVLRGNKWIGAALFALFLTMEVYVNHVQVAYYMAIMLGFFALAEAWGAIREKRISDFVTRGALALVGVGFALLCNAGLLWSTYAYGKHTTRGPSELTITAAGDSAAANRTTGLNKDYVTAWSYGKQESLSLLVPNAKGGASGSLITKQEDIENISDPAFRNEVLKKYQAGGRIDSYWGDQTFTSGPVYIGAIVALLMLLMLSRAEGHARWWLLASLLMIPLLINITSPMLVGALVIAYLVAGIFLWKDTLGYALFSAFFLTLLLSWGRNYMPLTDFFLDHVPGYDKFRAVTIILVICEITAPVLGVLYLDRLLREGKWDKSQEKRFLIPAGVFAFVLLVLAIMPGSLLDFFSDREKQELAAGGAKMQAYIDGLKNARIGVLSADAWRSFGYVVVAAGLLFAFGRRMIGKPVLLGALAVLILADLWTVDRRYVNAEPKNGFGQPQWEDERASQLPYKPEPVDLAILQAEQNANTEADFTAARERLKQVKSAGNGLNKMVGKDEEVILRFGSLRRTTNYRVLNLRDPFNDARVSYFHKSVGGYHGAKLKRYQELIEFHLSKEIGDIIDVFQNAPTQARVDSVLEHTRVIDMLNTRYLVYADDKAPIRNPHASGVGWFVDEVKSVKNADEEIAELGKIDPRHTALVDERFAKDIDASKAHRDSTATVSLKSYRTNDISYTVRSASGGVVVFSEIWYGDDWFAEIDGQPATYARADYVLRAMNVPAGEHVVRFHIVAKAYETGARIASMGSWVLLLLVLAALGISLRTHAARTAEPQDQGS